MAEAIDLQQLQRDVHYLMDRTAILDCVNRHARGHDRFDVNLLTACYHPDGVDEHGSALNPGPEYAEWANKVHAAGSKLHTHNITTHTCEIDGDTAHCESYVMVMLLNNDEQSARVISGRYLDQLERRDGVWKILVRRTTVDVLLSGDASILSSSVFRDQGYAKGVRDGTDISYQRPPEPRSSPQRW
ncbi:MAG: nuclear transport factor 2 family protein [Halioglobus sp.]|nr:nuclear transport factor 2 family protein [Halioglobus sp.]